jgi:F-box domain
MSAIPVDVLREILEHVCEADLVTLCRVNKFFCSCSQDVLYREIGYRDARTITIQTLAQSTDLARRVRSFKTVRSFPELATALRNMSSLRSLDLYGHDFGDDASILDGCTFKLDSFSTTFPYSESLQQFLNSQPSITDITFGEDCDPFLPFDERCLPNLTRVSAVHSWLGVLIPGRPVREVYMFLHSSTHSTDWSFFTLSTTPIQKLEIDYNTLPKPVSLLVSTFPSLVHLVVYAYVKWTVRVTLCSSF